MASRRGFLAGLAAAGFGLSGCLASSSDGKQAADIVVGPNSRLTFEPVELTVPIDATVTWYFDSSGHNVSGVPDHDGGVSLPADAAPFSSYGDAGTHRTVPRGETFSHAFPVPGTYRYVCIPHVPAMAGELTVTD